MNIVFIGCVQIGYKCLKQILKDGWNVQAVFTLDSRHAKKTSGYIDFSQLTEKHSVPLYKVKDINESCNINIIEKLKPDLVIVCGWQRLVSKHILMIPAKGVIGFHSSLLPEYRGRAPVNWAIIMGEKKTGITMFYCESEADTGDIIAQKSFPIGIKDTCGTVYDKSARAACSLLREHLPKIEKGTVKRRSNSSASFKFWPKRTPEDGRIDWNKGALEIHNWIRAQTHPYPGAFTVCGRRKYHVWGSYYEKKAESNMSRSPGEVIEIKPGSSGKMFLVAAKDKPLWIFDLRLYGKDLAADVSVGKKFV